MGKWNRAVLALAACSLLLAALLPRASFAAAPKSAFTPGTDGWLTLFDGSDLAHWEPEKGSDWARRDGVLAGSKGQTLNSWHWTDFELAATLRGTGSLRFRLSLAPMPDQPGYWLDLATGTIRAPRGRLVAKGIAAQADGWREVRLAASKGRFTVHFDGKRVAEGADDAFPAMGMLGLVAAGKPLQLKLLRIRPLNREKHINVPSPNTACFVCHANFKTDAITRKHTREEVFCATCHGPSLAHRSDEDNVTTPDVMFTRGEVDAACLKCHERHKRERKRKDGLHRGLPPRPAVCTDCHGSHVSKN